MGSGGKVGEEAKVLGGRWASRLGRERAWECKREKADGEKVGVLEKSTGIERGRFFFKGRKCVSVGR